MIPHELIMNYLKDQIADTAFLSLIKKLLQTGYINPVTKETVTTNRMGIPQGGILSPILCNIVLHRFDKFMEEYINKFEKGKSRRNNPEYLKLQYRKRIAKTFKERKKYLNLMRQIPARDPMDPNFKRMYYIRYADDFIVLITGSIDDAKLTKIRAKDALKRLCGADLNSEKTLITNIKDGFEFLGAQIRKLSRNPEFIGRYGNGNNTKVHEGRLLLNAPINKILMSLEKAGFVKRVDTNN